MKQLYKIFAFFLLLNFASCNETFHKKIIETSKYRVEWYQDDEGITQVIPEKISIINKINNQKFSFTEKEISDINFTFGDTLKIMVSKNLDLESSNIKDTIILGLKIIHIKSTIKLNDYNTYYEPFKLDNN